MTRARTPRGAVLLAASLLAACGGAQTESATTTALERRAEERPQNLGRMLAAIDTQLDAARIGDAERTLALALAAHPDDPALLERRLRLAELDANALIWADAWSRLFATGAAPDPEQTQRTDVALMLDAFGHVLRTDLAGAFALAERIAPRAPTPDPLEGMVATVDRRLYQLYYSGAFESAGELLAAARGAFGAQVALDKHEVALAFESRRRDAAAVLAQVADGRPEVVRAFAVEFAARGAHRSASGCWRALAADATGDDAPALLRAAAEAEYAQGRREEARLLVEQSVLRAATPVRAAVAAWELMRDRRDTQNGAVLIGLFADSVACDDATADELVALELAAAEATLDTAPPLSAARVAAERLLRRAETCAEPRIARDGAGVLIGRYRFAEARPLLEVAAAAFADDPAVARSLVAVCEQAGDGAAAAAAARAYIAAVLGEGEGPVEASEAGALDRTAQGVLTVLDAGESAELAEVRAAFLRDITTRIPDGTPWVLAWASELESQGLIAERRALLERYLEASGGGLQARFAVAMWLAERRPEVDEAIAALTALADDPVAASTESPRLHRGGWTMAEVAALTTFDLAPLTDDASRIGEAALRRLVALRGPALASTWQYLWDEHLITPWLDPATQLRLLEDALAAGFETPEVWIQVGATRLELHDDTGAAAAMTRAIDLDPAALDDALDVLETFGALHLAIPLIDRLGEPTTADEAAQVARIRLRLLRAPQDAWTWVQGRARTDAAIARFVALGGDPDAIALASVEQVGLTQAAALLRVASTQAGHALDDSDRVRLLVAALETDRGDTAVAVPGAPSAGDLIEALAGTRDADVLRRTWLALDDAHRPADAARFARLYLSAQGDAGRQWIAALLEVADWFDTSALDADHAAFFDELFVAPAELLLDPAAPAPTRFVFSADRQADAAALLAVAAGSFSTRGQFARAAELARSALVADPDQAGHLSLAIDTLGRATDTQLDENAVMELVGLAGGGIEDAEEAADALMALGRHDLAAGLAQRAVAQAPTDPALLLLSAQALVEAGDVEGALRAANALLANLPGPTQGRTLWVTELEASVGVRLEALGALDALEQLSTATALALSAPERELMIAAAQSARGAADLARRRVDRVLAGGQVGARLIGALHAAGYVGDAIAQWRQNVARIGFSEHLSLASDLREDTVNRLGWDAMLDQIGQVSVGDPLLSSGWMAGELVYAGRPREASSELAAQPFLVADGDVLLQGAIDVGLGESERGLRALRRLLDRAGAQYPELWHAAIGPLVAAGQLDDARALLAEAQAGTVPTSALPLFELLRGDAAPALGALEAVAQGRSAMRPGEAAQLLHALRTLGYAGEADALGAAIAATPNAHDLDPVTLLAPGGANTEAVLRVAQASGGAGLEALDAVIDRALQDGHGAALLDALLDRLAPLSLALGQPETADRVARAARRLDAADAFSRIVDAVDAVGSPQMYTAFSKSLARVGAWDAACDLVDRADAVGARVDVPDMERARWLLLADRTDRLLQWLDARPTAAARSAHAGHLLTSLDLLLDAELALALTERLSAADAMSTPMLAVRVVAWASLDPARARDVASDGLARLQWHPRAAAAVIELLLDHGLRDVARAVADDARASGRVNDALVGLQAQLAAPDDAARAAELATEMAALAPDPFSALFALGGALVAAEAPDVADVVFTMALELEPLSTVTMARRGLARIEAGRVAAGLDDVRFAEARAPLAVPERVDLAQALLEHGHTDEALAAALELRLQWWPTARSQSLDEAPQSALSFVYFSLAEHDPIGGVEWLATAAPGVLYWPELAGDPAGVANLIEASGNPAAAVDVYRRSLLLTPDEPVLLNNAAYIWAEANQSIDAALAWGLQSVAIDDAAASSTLDTVAWALYRAGRYAEARRWMIAALRLDAMNTPTSGRLASRDVPASHLAAIETALRASTPPPEAPARGRRHRGTR